MAVLNQSYKMGGHICSGLGQVEFKLWAPLVNTVYLQARNIKAPSPYEDHSEQEIDRIVNDFIQESDYNYKIRNKNQLNPFPYKPESLKRNKWSYLFGNQQDLILMKPCGDGFFKAIVDGINSDYVYRFLLQSFNHLIPVKDPLSRFQPFGSDGWSQVVDHTSYKWSDQLWQEGKNPRKLLKTGFSKPETMVAAEIHIGTMTSEGTFDAAIKELEVIAADGIYNTVEIMPVAEFCGDYNWGYDGVDWYAPYCNYCRDKENLKSVNAFKTFVDKAHSLGLNVILDVVYNHFGSFFNIYDKFGQYLGPGTMWGPAPNFFNQKAKNLIIDNALYWLKEYHIDGLRLDATFCMPDVLLKEIVFEIRKQKPEAFLIAEDWRNTKRVVKKFDPELLKQHKLNVFELQKEEETNGYIKSLGYNAQWNPDFAHVLIALVTNKPMGMNTVFGYHIYKPFVADVARMLIQGFNFFNPEENESDFPPAYTFVNYALSHDEAGNFEGTRILIKILQNKIDLVSRVDQTPVVRVLVGQESSVAYEQKLNRRLEQLSASITYKLLKKYCRLKDEPVFDQVQWEGYQSESGVVNIITQESFEKALRESIDLNKLSIATLFIMPGHKMIFYGDEKGELAPFKFFADYPVDNLAERISQPEDKGYDIGKQAFEESKLNQWKEYKVVQEIVEETLSFTRNISRLFNSEELLRNAEFLEEEDIEFDEEKKSLSLTIKKENELLKVYINYSDYDIKEKISPEGMNWKLMLDSTSDNSNENGFIQVDNSSIIIVKARSVKILKAC